MTDSDLPPKEPAQKCNARRTDGSGYCQHRAGWGTDHTGEGRCRYHGGNTQQQEKKVIDDLSDAAEHAGIAIRLQLKHMRDKLERGEDIEASELDRLSRTVFDRTGHGPTSKQELENTGDDPLAEVVIDFDDADT